MNDWARFYLKIIAAVIAIVGGALTINGTGDCGPGVTDCGEFSRRLSFVTLAFGLIGVVYYAWLFVRARRKR